MRNTISLLVVVALAGTASAGKPASAVVELEITRNAPPADCDFDALLQKGDGQTARGSADAALVTYELALKCKAEPKAVLRAYLASCNARNAIKAKSYYDKLPTNRQASVLQICLRNGIDLASSDPGTASEPTTSRIGAGGSGGVGIGGGVGGRIALDVWSHGRWSIGAALDLTRVRYDVTSASGRFTDMTTTVYGAFTWVFGTWQGRSALGLGMLQTVGSVEIAGMSTSVRDSMLVVQVSGTVGRDLGSGWLVEVGPIFTRFTQRGDVGWESYVRTNSLLFYLGGAHHF